MNNVKEETGRRRCNVYTGVYFSKNKGMIPITSTTRKVSVKMHHLWRKLKCYLIDVLDIMIDHYSITAILAILLLSLFVPLLTKAVHDYSETKALKKIVYSMTKEVAQAQTNCEELADELCSIHWSIKDVETGTAKSFSICPSCECIPKSQAVQSEGKKNFLQRLFRSNRGSSPLTNKAAESNNT